MISLIKKAARIYKRINEEDWPIVKSFDNFEPNFIFLLTPPNSGSTAISQVFNNSPNISQLQERGEGQWLIKGLCSNDRWNANKKVNKRSIRSVWTNECKKKYKSEGAMYFIEKSPPNMMRIEVLQSIFPNHILLANNRDPYANVSSMLYRYTKDIDTLSSKEREFKVLKLVKSWKERSDVLKRIIQSQNVLYLSYEQFCETPNLLQDAINSSAFSGQINLEFEKDLKVKDYKPQPIINLNQKQIEKLNNFDIDTISSFLHDSKDLLSFFGYGLR